MSDTLNSLTNSIRSRMTWKEVNVLSFFILGYKSTEQRFITGFMTFFTEACLMQCCEKRFASSTQFFCFCFFLSHLNVSEALGLQRITARAVIHKWRKHGTATNLDRRGQLTKIQEVTKQPRRTSKELHSTVRCQ